MPPADPILASRRRVFESVFPPASLDSFTSDIAATAPTTPILSSPARHSTTFTPSSPDQATWDQAWRIATTFLSVPDKGLDVLVRAGEAGERELMRQFNRNHAPSEQVIGSMRYLVHTVRMECEMAEEVPVQRSILDWYGHEIRRHFLKNFRGGLSQLLNHTEKEELLRKIVHCLELARKIYFYPLMEYLIPLLDSDERDRAFVKMRRGFHMMVTYALPWPQVSGLLTQELTRDTLVILGIDTLVDWAAEETNEDDMQVDRRYSVSYQDWRDEQSEETRQRMMIEEEGSPVAVARERLLSLLNSLQLVGLGGDKTQRVFAMVMNTMMTEFVRAAYTGHWEGPSWAHAHLHQWIENVFARLVVQALAIINAPESAETHSKQLDVRLNDVEKWQEIGIARLGALRTGELFDIVVEWPASSGAIDDLRHFTTYPAARSHLTHSFIAVLNRRLLHPGASTVEILQLYISIIRAFNMLDPKGVLLDRIARPIRRYLRDRDDTVKVIVGGLLADPDDVSTQTTSAGGETLVELSAELTKAHQDSLRHETGELDWDDMNWVPDPVDAAPDYRKSKTSDVVGSLISLFESKDTFVKTMQSMLADRLLQKRADYDQEMSVLELLKLRFGDNALQACEVMLRDIFDSRRVDAVVRNDQGLSAKQLHSKILSHFFWPQIPEQEFAVPSEILELQQRYAAGFGSLKQSRKLTWLNGLGQVTVELDLEDRVFVDEVTTWQATVIYAFQSESSTSPTSKTVSELEQELSMTPTLVRSACLFWVSKRILAEGPRDTFRVMEVLPNEEDEKAALGGTNVSGAENEGTDNARGDASEAAARADAAAAAAAHETAEAAAMEKMHLYWQFIVGMLTNQGAMPLQRIVMMLKMVVPGGFPFSNDELREFLAGMVSRGKLEVISGGSYKIVQ